MRTDTGGCSSAGPAAPPDKDPLEITDTALITKTEIEKIAPFVSSPVSMGLGEDQISIVQFWRVLQKRRTLVLSTLGIVLLLVVVASLLLPKHYEATARIL